MGAQTISDPLRRPAAHEAGRASEGNEFATFVADVEAATDKAAVIDTYLEGKEFPIIEGDDLAGPMGRVTESLDNLINDGMPPLIAVLVNAEPQAPVPTEYSRLFAEEMVPLIDAAQLAGKGDEVVVAALATPHLGEATGEDATVQGPADGLLRAG